MIIAIIVSAFSGTLVMTLYSYLISNIKNQQFREPDILANLILKLVHINMEEKWNFLVGSIAHFLAGLFFMFLYWLLWEHTFLTPTMPFGVIAGFISGIFGVLIWYGTFKLHPNPPDIDFQSYYGQLIIAHVFFGLGATGTYMLFYA